MKKIHYYIYTFAALLLAACSADNGEQVVGEQKLLSITSSIAGFEGEGQTRANVVGTAFATGDLVRLKVICPFTKDSQLGESTWGNTYDSFWLLRWNGSAWNTMTSDEHFDITGSYSYSGSTDIFAYPMAQGTPYVFTAISWTEERLFRTKDNTLVGQYCNVFHHDQSREKNYAASDLLWAQQFSQTAPQNIHLTFNHVLACLVITINDAELTKPNPDYDPETNPSVSPTIPAPISDAAILTLEGMPNIDQQEIVVGDYYAEASKSNSSYGYRQKASCSYENNAKVLGIASIDETKTHVVVHPFSGGIATIGGLGASYQGAVVPNTGIYTCHNVGSKTYRVIVPPCVLTENATFWLRDDNRRYKMTLDRTTFVQGHLYKVTMTLKETTGNNDQNDDDNDNEDQNNED